MHQIHFGIVKEEVRQLHPAWIHKSKLITAAQFALGLNVLFTHQEHGLQCRIKNSLNAKNNKEAKMQTNVISFKLSNRISTDERQGRAIED